ncbi:response regulator [Pseudomonas koreensis]|uniref:response regulator n=1 Tax=Pseudomonas koreensis TaxID=198620 RepID=UPI003F86936D
MLAKIVVVDDHPVARLSVKYLLERHGYDVVGEAQTGVEALQLTRDLQPDLLILDIGIPKLNGLEVLARLRASQSQTAVLIFTSEERPIFVRRCITAGAAGFVLKQENLDSFLEAVRAVLAGKAYHPVIKELEQNVASPSADAGLDILSDRELSVLIGLVRGKTSRRIAEEMLISDKTVNTYKHRLQRKLKVSNLLELASLARANGLID